MELLKKLGADCVFNSSEPGWEEEFGKLAKELKAKACLECVAGDLTG